jgi:hypothetical protein
MKLRIKGSTVRIRIDQRDLEQLVRTGRIEDGLQAGLLPEHRFGYAIQLVEGISPDPAVRYENGLFLVEMGRATACQWSQSAQVGFRSDCPTGSDVLTLVLEKDFACLDRPAGEEADDAFAFPNPAAGCGPGACGPEGIPHPDAS